MFNVPESRYNRLDELLIINRKQIYKSAYSSLLSSSRPAQQTFLPSTTIDPNLKHRVVVCWSEF